MRNSGERLLRFEEVGERRCIRGNRGQPHRRAHRLLIDSVFVMVALVLADIKLASAQEPTLSETLDWMDSTYNPHPGGSFGYGEVELSADGKVFKRTLDTFSSVGCLITMHETEVWLTSGEPDLINHISYTVDLKDVDPNSLATDETESGASGLSCSLVPDVATCDTSELQFETFDQKPLMITYQDEIFPHLSGKDHESKGAGSSFVSWFYFNDLSYAPRFVQAFRHAIDLCGGKPSPF